MRKRMSKKRRLRKKSPTTRTTTRRRNRRRMANRVENKTGAAPERETHPRVPRRATL